ncbi:MAG: hypothetical protein KIG65_00835 [Eubacteriales bacterium]|nr:hypothetical protein [Eubacteriales bacterium]
MKKAIAFIAACAILLLSINTNVFAASDSGYTYNEKLYSDACGLINALDVGVSVSDSSIDEDITRIELLRNAYKILNRGIQPGSINNETLSLTDVNEDDKGYLEFAAYCGIINYKDRYFYPDKSADFEFAQRTMLCLVSYYNDNTINRSLKNDLTKGLRKTASKSLKAGDAYVMIYNLLMSTQPYGVFIETPLLKGLYNLEKAKVKVIGNSLGSYNGKATAEGRVRVEFSNGYIDDFSYSGDTKDILGRYANIYYNAQEESVSFITPYNNDDIIVEFTEKQFVSFDSDTRIIYWKELKSSNRWDSSYIEKDKYITKTTDIIYNGVFISNQNRVYDILKKNTENIDKIQLISTDRSKNIDLIKIDAYTTAYVDNVNSSGYVIRDKASGRLITLDPNENIENVTVEDTDGNPIAFESIASKSVISIFDVPAEEQGYKLVVSKNAMDGMVSSVKEDGNRLIIVADGIEYQFANGLSDYADKMQIGFSYILYSDHNGLIAGYEHGSLVQERVGGIISTDFNAVDLSFSFRIFTIFGEIKEFTTSNNFKVNGAKTEVNDDFTVTVRNDEDVNTTMTIGEFRRYIQKSLVQYKLDGEGRIRELIMPRKNAKAGNIGYTVGMNNPDATISNPTVGRMRYKKNSQLFIPHENASIHNFTAVKPDAKVIYIPSAEFTDRENYFTLGKLADLRNDYYGAVMAYTFEGGKAFTADIIAIVQGGTSAPSGNVFYVVKKITDSINKEGEIGKLIRCVNVTTGADVEFTTETTVFPEYTSAGSKGDPLPISVGDIIQIGTNAYGDASAFKLTYDCDAGVAKNEKENAWYAEKRLVYANVCSVSGSYFTYETENLPGQVQIGTCKSVISVEQNGKHCEIKVDTPSSLVGKNEDPVHYSRIIYLTIYGEPIACIAYR